MGGRHRHQRILVVTSSPACLTFRATDESAEMSHRANRKSDIAALVETGLHRHIIDIHVAVPYYRLLIGPKKPYPNTSTWRCPHWCLPSERFHFAQDRSFYFCKHLSADASRENIRMALAFQREVINRVIPEVRPDLVHCWDWFTGLIPSACRSFGIPCVFTCCAVNTARLLLSDIEDCGIDAGAFWQNCYYSRMPRNYQETRESNPVDLLLSAVFAADYVTIGAPEFLHQIGEGLCPPFDPVLQRELQIKYRSGCFSGRSPVEAYERLLCY